MVNKNSHNRIKIEQLRYALDNVPAYVYIKDENSHYLYANKLTLELFGCDEDALLGQCDSKFFSLDTVRRLREVDLKVLHGEHTQEEMIVNDLDGELRIYWEVKTPIYSDSGSGEIIGILGISTDITERKQLEERLSQAATTEPLTGLFNRRRLIEQLTNAMQKGKRHPSYGAVIFIDLDRFKELNDLYGHTCGDQHLVEVARRISNEVREYDIVARFGGDEFVVLLEELDIDEHSAQQKAELIADKIFNSLKGIYTISGHTYQGSASIGLSLFSGNQRSVEAILAEADKSMYEAKRQDH